uniref:Photosystem II reaction center Psb28 protein n=1 Tax=Heterorhabditis bacteriophora TaxID=37862 RepID=A0A1I7XDY5_HETBA
MIKSCGALGSRSHTFMSAIVVELSSAVVSASAPPAKKARVVELADNQKEPSFAMSSQARKNGQEPMETDSVGLDKNLYSRQMYSNYEEYELVFSAIPDTMDKLQFLDGPIKKLFLSNGGLL